MEPELISAIEQGLKEKETPIVEVKKPDEGAIVPPVGDQVQKTEEEIKAEKEQNEKFEQKWNERFKEKFGEEWSDEVVTKYKTPKIEVQKATYHELAEKATKFIESEKYKGKEKEGLKDFIEYQLTDYSEMAKNNPLSIISKKMKEDFPNLNEKQITALVNKKYDVANWSQEGEQETEEEVLSKAILAKDSHEAEKYFNEKKINIEKQNNEPSELQKQEMQKNLDALQNGIRNSLKDYKKETFVLDKDNSFEYDKIDTTNLEKEIFEKASSPTQYAINRYTDSKGNIDYEKLRKETIILNNFNEILKTVETKGIEKGRKIGLTEGEIAAIKELKNTNFTPSKKATNIAPPKPQEKASEEFLRASLGIKN